MRSFTLLLLTAPLLTVFQETPRPSKTPEMTSKTTTANKADNLLAGWMLIDSNNEIAIAQLAEQRAQDPEVKQFAQKMISDHREFAQKLQKYAPTNDFGGRPGAKTGHDNEPSREGGPNDDMSGGDNFDHAALIQELGRQSLESARKELEQKSGYDFDRAYMDMMVAEHMKGNDMLTVFQRHASGELKTAFAEGQRTVAMHLEHAKDICKKLESRSNDDKRSDDKRGDWKKDDDEKKEDDKQ